MFSFCFKAFRYKPKLVMSSVCSSVVSHMHIYRGFFCNDSYNHHATTIVYKYVISISYLHMFVLFL